MKALMTGHSLWIPIVLFSITLWDKLEWSNHSSYYHSNEEEENHMESGIIHTTISRYICVEIPCKFRHSTQLTKLYQVKTFLRQKPLYKNRNAWQRKHWIYLLETYWKGDLKVRKTYLNICCFNSAHPQLVLRKRQKEKENYEPVAIAAVSWSVGWEWVYSIDA